MSELGIITIDGPAASGKSSAARLLAERYGVPYISSGTLYRAVAYLALGSETDLHNGAALLAMLGEFRVVFEADTKGNYVLVNGTNVTGYLATEAVDGAVSFIARIPEVREWVNEKLQHLSAPFVIDGRDMGTAVFPDAQVKFFLTASPRVRAQRRQKERGEDVAAIEAALIARDELDKKQSAPAADAVWIDSSELSLPEVLAAMSAQLPGIPT